MNINNTGHADKGRSKRKQTMPGTVTKKRDIFANRDICKESGLWIVLILSIKKNAWIPDKIKCIFV